MEIWKDSVHDGIVVTERLPDGSYLTTIYQGGPLDGWTLPTLLSGGVGNAAVERTARKIARGVHEGAVAMANGVQTYGTAT